MPVYDEDGETPEPTRSLADVADPVGPTETENTAW